MGVIEKIFAKKIEHLVNQKLAEAIPSDIDSDAHLYRRLGASDRDLNPITHERMLKIVFHLYDRNPLAHRILELTKDFVVGAGISYQAEEEGVQAVLDDFWTDPINNWDLKQHNRALELGLFGEQCYPVFVNPYNGAVRLGSLDPALIGDIKTNPQNAEEIENVVVKSDRVEEKLLRVVHMDEEPGSPTVGRLIGDCFFFAVNKISLAKRGRSDLLSLADWIDGYEQMLFNRLDRVALINAFVWDVSLEGMNKEEIADWLRKNPSPKPGAVRAHNEKVKWEAVTPDLKASDGEKEARLIRNFILSGAGFPDHWFSEGSTVNRATAQEMGVPTLKRLSARQRYFRYMIEYIFRFVIDQAIIHGRLSPEINTDFQLVLPELTTRDTQKITESLERLSRSLMLAVQQGWLSIETAGKIYIEAVNQLGTDIDPETELKKAKAEKKDEGYEDYTNQSPQKQGETDGEKEGK